MNQRWEEGRSTYRPDGELIRTSEYETAEISIEAARRFVETHHYSRSMPAARYSYGLLRHGNLVGAAVFSQPTNNRTVTKHFPEIHHKEGIELGRLVLLDEVPGNGESWFVARCFEQLRKAEVVDRDGRELRGILAVASFSDPMPRRTSSGQVVMPGHVGCVYQALNACYVGRADARTLHLLPDGRVLNHRTEQKIRRQEVGWRYGVEELQSYGAGPLNEEPRAWLERWLPEITRPLRHLGNHKYLWALNRRMRRHLPDSISYPKKIDQAA